MMPASDNTSYELDVSEIRDLDEFPHPPPADLGDPTSMLKKVIPETGEKKTPPFIAPKPSNGLSVAANMSSPNASLTRANGTSAQANGSRSQSTGTLAMAISVISKPNQAPPSTPSTSTPTTPVTNNNSGKDNSAYVEAFGGKEGKPLTRIGLHKEYLKTRQAALKIFKALCLIAMTICFSLSLSGIMENLPKEEAFESTWAKVPALQYGLAIAVMGLIMEIFFFVYYLMGLFRKIEKFLKRKGVDTMLVITAYHSLMSLLFFIAPIILHATWTGKSVTAYIAFDTLVLVAYSFDVYYNVSWIRGGTEHESLPCFE